MYKYPFYWLRINELMYHYKEYIAEILFLNHHVIYKQNNLQQLAYV